MFSGALNYVTSVFRGFIGNDQENDTGHELDNINGISSRESRDILPRSRDAETFTERLKRMKQTNDVAETCLGRNNDSFKDFTDNERDDIREMLAEITSRETGYFSSDSESDFENISIGDTTLTSDRFANTPYSDREHSSARDGRHSNLRILSADEIRIEHNSSVVSHHDQNCDVRDARGTDYDVDTTMLITEGGNTVETSTISKLKYNIEAIRSGSINEGFAVGIEDGETSTSERLVNNNDIIASTEQQTSARRRWKKVADSRTFITHSGGKANVLVSNPKVVEALTKSYLLAKERLKCKYRPTKFEIFKNVHLRRAQDRFSRFLDGQDHSHHRKVV